MLVLLICVSKTLSFLHFSITKIADRARSFEDLRETHDKQSLEKLRKAYRYIFGPRFSFHTLLILRFNVDWAYSSLKDLGEIHFSHRMWDNPKCSRQTWTLTDRNSVFYCTYQWATICNRKTLFLLVLDPVNRFSKSFPPVWCDFLDKVAHIYFLQ